MATISSQKRKYDTKSLKTKYEALVMLENQEMPAKDVAFKFGVKPSTLSTWKKGKEKIMKDFVEFGSCKRKRVKRGTFEQVNKACYEWLLQIRAKNIPVNGPIILEKAQDFAAQLEVENFQASHGWLYKWKKRYDIKLKDVDGEGNKVTPEMAVPWYEISLSTILSKYNLRDIYNLDEFGLFYQSLPNDIMHMRNEKCVIGKHSKLRLTGLAAWNALGEKLPLFIISKSHKPRCFQGVKTLPCRYRAQKNSWMNGELFEEWVKEVDTRFQREGRNVAMIIDNCSAHPDIDGLKAIELIRLPTNTTSNTQLMDQGIIRSLKAKYRHISIRRILGHLDSGKSLPTTSILEALLILVKSWNAVEEKTLVNLFRKSGISPKAKLSAINDDDQFKEFGNDGTMDDLQFDLDTLRQSHPDLVPDDCNAEKLVSVDNLVETSGPKLTEGGIVAEIICPKDDEEEVVKVDDDQLVPPSIFSVENAVETLLKFNMFYEDDKLQQLINDLSTRINCLVLKKKKQAILRDLFT